MILSSFIFVQYQRVTDRRTDRRMDRIAVDNTALCIASNAAALYLVSQWKYVDSNGWVFWIQISDEQRHPSQQYWCHKTRGIKIFRMFYFVIKDVFDRQTDGWAEF